MDALFIFFFAFVPYWALYAVVLGMVILVSSAVRRTSPATGFLALGWALTVWIAVTLAVSTLRGIGASLEAWLAGAVLTFVLVRRGGYDLDPLSWILLLLGPLGWFFALWRRNNKLAQQTAAARAG